MTDRVEFPLPISYAQARIACASAAVMLRTAGPASFKIPPAQYAQIVLELEQAGELLDRIEERRLARLAREQGSSA